MLCGSRAYVEHVYFFLQLHDQDVEMGDCCNCSFIKHFRQAFDKFCTRIWTSLISNLNLNYEFIANVDKDEV